jgi:integrase
MIKHHTPSENGTSEQAVNKQASRFTAAYWASRVYRPTYNRNGETFEVAEWYAQIQHAGRREKVGLATNDREAASRKAGRFYQTLRSKGWAAALVELDPERAAPRNVETVGGYLSTCEPLFDGRKITWIGYAYAIRKIAREIATGRDDSAEKYDPFHKTWQVEADKIKLAVLDPLSISKWKRESIQAAGNSPVAQLRARRNVNSFLLNARTLFGKKMARRRTAAKLPTVPNPFDGVELENGGDVHYVSTIQAKDLLSAAKAELEQSDPEAYKVILLALGAGLRRGEIDSLCTTQLDFQQSQIRVMTTDMFQTKTEGSEGIVFVDPGLLDELKKHLGSDSLFVVAPTVAPSENRAPGYYRCADVFKSVTAWLRAHGIASTKPIHTLRKEFGSLVNQATDIHTASRQLRHATIKMTAAVYTDHRRRPGAAVPIGAMLAPAHRAKGGKEAGQ